MEESFSIPLKPRRGKDHSGASPSTGVGSSGVLAEETVPPVSGLAIEGTRAAPKGTRRMKVAMVSLPLVLAGVVDFGGIVLTPFGPFCLCRNERNPS